MSADGFPEQEKMACINSALNEKITQMPLGVHYPSDVIAGVLTGTIYAVITVAIYRKFFKDKKHSEK